MAERAWNCDAASADKSWVGGFEVCEVVNDGGQFRYRLRRQSDGYVLPVLFDDAALREAGSSYSSCNETTGQGRPHNALDIYN
jgi:hypothetical protein